MQRALQSSAAPASARASKPVRDALGALGMPTLEGRALHASLRDLLQGGTKGRREGENPILAHPRLAPARFLPLLLAVRDELLREDPPPRGLGRRFDALLTAVSEASRARRASAAGRPAGSRRARGSSGVDGEHPLLPAVLDLLPDGVVTIRRSGRIGVWNRAAAAIAGRRRRDVQRRGAASLFRDPKAYEGIVAKLESDGGIGAMETLLASGSGEDVPVRLLAVRLEIPDRGAAEKEAEDDPDRYVLHFHDLTEVDLIRRRLIETENLSAMAKIAGSVAHEFRNPLNSLFLSADLLEDELAGSGAPEEAIAPTLGAIREEVERLNQIITHYLALSKVASNAPEVVELGTLVGEFAEEWTEQARERGVELRVRIHDGDSAVRVDPNQVRRVLVNLMENAFDAIVGEAEEQEGEETGRLGIVSLVVRPMQRTVKLTVRDNGPGIPEEIRSRVLEPFFTSKARGSGLGLYLVREIVLAHGGTLSISSNGSRGTSVSTRWPRPVEGSRVGGESS